MTTAAKQHAEFNKFLDCVQYVMTVENTNRTNIGGVEFSIDRDGPWAGELSYFPETSKWDNAAIIANLKLRLMIVNAPNPEVERCVTNNN